MMRRILLTILITFCSSTAYAAPSKALEDQLVQSAPGKVDISYHSGTGKIRFLKGDHGKAFPNVSGRGGKASPAEAATGFLSTYGPLFGIDNANLDLKVKRDKYADRGRSFVRYQQMHKGVPVFGGEMVVQLDAGKDVISVHGKTSPDLSLDVTPAVDPAAAVNTALALVASQYNIDPSNLISSNPELWIYNPVLLGHDLNKNFLVWRVEVKPNDLAPVNELVLVDAQEGMIALHFNQISHAKNRQIYNNNDNYLYGLPGNGPVRVEGGAATGDNDSDKAYTYTGYAYDFYLAYHGRDWHAYKKHSLFLPQLIMSGHRIQKRFMVWKSVQPDGLRFWFCLCP